MCAHVQSTMEEFQKIHSCPNIASTFKLRNLMSRIVINLNTKCSSIHVNKNKQRSFCLFNIVQQVSCMHLKNVEPIIYGVSSPIHFLFQKTTNTNTTVAHVKGTPPSIDWRLTISNGSHFVCTCTQYCLWKTVLNKSGITFLFLKNEIE